MSLPYRIVLIVALLTGVAFVAGPWWTLRQITMAATENDGEAWQRLVNVKDIQSYTGQLLKTMMDSKLLVDIRKAPGEAIRDYQQSSDRLAIAVQQLNEPKAFPRLACGEVLDDVAGAAEAGGCWALDGEMQWQSPLLVRVVFTHPQTHWQSSLFLLRTGLFSWQLDSIDLPVDAMLERFAALAKDDAI